MSGGALDYVCFRLDDPIKEIRNRINKNGKTLQQIWDEKSEDEKKDAIEFGHDWEIPWNGKNVPDIVRAIAEDETWKKCNHVVYEGHGGYISKSLPTKKARDEWNKIYNDTIKDLINSHNNGIEHEIYSPKTIETMKKMLDTIIRAKIYLKRIEWLLSGDDGENDLIERTKADLEEEGLDGRL